MKIKLASRSKFALTIESSFIKLPVSMNNLYVDKKNNSDKP